MGHGSAFSRLKENFRDRVMGEEWTLRRALIDRNTGKVRRMLEKNPAAADYDLEAVCGWGKRKPLHFAAGYGDVDMLELLLQPPYFKGNIDLRDSGGATPLMLVARTGNDPILKDLIARGADVNAVDNDGLSPLCYACHAQSAAAARLLIARGADVNGSAGSCPPVMAVTHHAQQLPMLELLLSKGADPNRQDKNGETPLKTCLNHPNHAGISLLLDYGATPTGSTGAAMIWSAAVLKNDALVEKLLAAGADPAVPMDDKGIDVMTLISGKATPETREKLRRHIATAEQARNAEAVVKEMAAGAAAAISIKPIKLKLS